MHDYGRHRPDELKIFGTKWRVVWFADIEEMGLCDQGTQTISINKDISPTLAVDVLIHEVMHAIYWFGCLPEKVKEEQVVSVLASGLNQVFSDNPKLALWVSEVHNS